MAKKLLQSVLIKPAGPDCNLTCNYCFYLKKSELFDQAKSHRMTIDILEETIRQGMTQGSSQVSFGWQGGEPSLMGLPFFEKAVDFQQKYGRNQTVGNGLQTNGLLIDEKWANFFNSYNFLVGLSIDGPEEIHNHYRRSAGGKGSWSSVVEAAQLLLDTGVDVNALTVLNDFTSGFPEEIYRFLKDLGFRYMQFIPCIEPDPSNPSQVAPFSVSPENFGHFLCTVFDLWQADFKDGRPTTSIRLFDSLLHCYLQQEAPECTLQRKCGDYLVIEHNGDVYSCDFFVEPSWQLGNVRTNRLVDMLNSSRQKRFGGQKSILAKQCQSCRWLEACYGGCPKDRLNNPQGSNISAFCKAHQIFFEHAHTQLQELAQQLIAEQPSGINVSSRKTRSTKQVKVGRNQSCPCGSGRKYKKCCGKNV